MKLRWAWLGRVAYRTTWELQEALRRRVLAGDDAEVLLLLEHDAVITLGRSAKQKHVLFSAESLRERGVELCETSRGGDVTYHGPGQLVGYPIVRLQAGVLNHVRGMLEGVADAIGPLGVTAEFRREHPGLWVGAAKICAVGVHIRRGVSVHGFALNVGDDLAGFDLIVPCGLCAPVTSLSRLGGEAAGAATPAGLATSVAARVAQRFGRDAEEISLEDVRCLAG